MHFFCFDGKIISSGKNEKGKRNKQEYKSCLKNYALVCSSQQFFFFRNIQSTSSFSYLCSLQRKPLHVHLQNGYYCSGIVTLSRDFFLDFNTFNPQTISSLQPDSRTILYIFIYIYICDSLSMKLVWVGPT